MPQNVNLGQTTKYRQTTYLTSKQHLFENISGKESINSDRKRLDGQIEHLYPPYQIEFKHETLERK